MSIAIKSVSDIAKKWSTVTPQRTEDYTTGVQNPRKSWAANTKAAESAYEAGVQKAVTKKSFGKGVSAAGDSKWQEGATTKGVARWGAGVAGSGSNYEAGFAPYASAIASTTLPPRYAKRDPRNLERVRAVVDSVSKAKEATIK